MAWLGLYDIISYCRSGDKNFIPVSSSLLPTTNMIGTELLSVSLLLILCSWNVKAFLQPSSRTYPPRWRLQQGSGPHSEDFDRLYQDQTAEYGVDLARQFQKEQQMRIRGRIDKQSVVEDKPKNSPGYFSNQVITRISSVPTNARRRIQQARQDAWTTKSPESSNEDNWLMIMSATVAAVSPSTTTPILLSISALLLSLSLSFFFILGDESPISTKSIFPSEIIITDHSTLFSQIQGL